MDPAFTSYKLNSSGLVKAADIATMFDSLYRTLQLACPIGRELSLVHTKLEEACFYAKKAMAADPQNHEP